MECSGQQLPNSTKNCTEPHFVTLLEWDYAVGVTYVTLAAILAVTGTVGNSIILYITRVQKMNQCAKIFITNQAIADLCVSVVANPMCIAGAIMGMHHFERMFWFCQLVACVCLSTCVCAFFNIANLTVNRWLFVCHNSVYSKIYTRGSVIALSVAAWTLGFLVELPNFLGWGGHTFDKKLHQCIWDRRASRSYTLFLGACLMLPLFVFNGYCQVAIFVKLWGVKGAIGLFEVANRNTLIRSFRSAKTLLGLFVTFVICWTPYIVVHIADHDDTYSMETYLFVTLLAHAHSCIPFFVYLCLNKRFLEQLKRSTQTWLRRPVRNSIHPMPAMPYGTPKPPLTTNPTHETETRNKQMSTQLTLGQSIETESSFM